MEKAEHTEIYRKHQSEALQALNLLAAQFEASGQYDMALDCRESMTALRNGDLALASGLMLRVGGPHFANLSAVGDDTVFTRELAISHLAGLQEHLLEAEPVEDLG